MSWIGKILAVLGMILAVFAMWLTTSAFVTRTNWKAQADMYKKAFEDAKGAREAEYATNLSQRDALARQLKTEETRAAGLEVIVAKGKTENEAVAAKNAELSAGLTKLQAEVAELQANLTAQQGRADKLQTQNGALQDEKIKLTLTADNAIKEKQAAETVARQSQAERLIADQKLEVALAQLADEKANRGTAGGTTGSGANLFSTRPTPVPEGARGTVETYKDGYVVLTLGIDHGVTTGATLDVYRPGVYLGTVVIDRAYPQQSVGTFRPADPRRTVRSLRADELPKAGDRVGRVGSVSAP